MSDLVKRLRIKAGMIEMGELIEWGSDSALMREAADALESTARGAREAYKLVPVEPTQEMVSAAEDAYMPFGDMDLALRMAILSAPDVQGEPVGWESIDGLPHDPDEDELFWFARSDGYVEGPRRIQPCGYDYDEFEFFRPVEPPALYAAPQPTAEVLAKGYFHPLPDENDYEFHDAEQFPDGSDCPACVPAVIVRRSAVENQLAPDVKALVEALEELVDLMEGIRQGEYTPDSFTTQPARIALAAYYEGGD